MRDRLSEMLEKAIRYADTHYPEGRPMEGTYTRLMADRLLSAGVIVPPCKVGDVVYVLRSQTSNGKNLYMREERISHYRLFGDYSVMCFESQRLGVFNHRWKEDVFLTKEEAERALAETCGKERGMKQYCRYCANLVYGDSCYCEKKKSCKSESSCKRPNKCKDFELNPIDAFGENPKEYKPREKWKDEMQATLFGRSEE